MPTGIQWTNETDNVIVPVVGGWYCKKVSPGCEHCYAETWNMNKKFGGNGLAYRVPMNGVYPRMKLRTDLLEKWQRQKKPKMHFVNSMTDTFGEWVDFEWVMAIFNAMATAPTQTFQVLTKRAERMMNAVNGWLEITEREQVPDNIWLGVSVEDHKRMERIPYLNAIPAAVRFLSVEPLLEGIDLGPHLNTGKIHWVIVGGESGNGAREMKETWARVIVQHCKHANVRVFVKQMGSVWAKQNGLTGKADSLDSLPTDLQVREYPGAISQATENVPV